MKLKIEFYDKEGIREIERFKHYFEQTLIESNIKINRSFFGKLAFPNSITIIIESHYIAQFATLLSEFAKTLKAAIRVTLPNRTELIIDRENDISSEQLFQILYDSNNFYDDDDAKTTGPKKQ